MTCVGSSVAVSGLIVHTPLFTVQAVRYVMAAALLLAIARAIGRPLPRPRGREWALLAALAATGLVLFNLAVVRGVAHAEPAVIGVAVASVPVVLAVAGPLLAGARPAPAAVVGAVVVMAGAVLVQGGGRTDAAGVGWAVLTCACEAAFTLLAAPLLGRLGAFAVSWHAVWMGAAGLGVLAVAVDGPAAVAGLTATDWLAAAHLAVVVTAVAFVLWYTAVRRIGADRAGLFTGIVPVAAALGGVLLGGSAPGPAVWAGAAVVGLGQVIGLRGRLARTWWRRGTRRGATPAWSPVSSACSTSCGPVSPARSGPPSGCPATSSPC